MLENLQNKLKNLNNKQRLIVFICLFIIIILVFFILYKFFYTEDEEMFIENETESQENEIEENENSKIGILDDKKTVTVHVVGEVNTPGVVTLEEGSRIIDAINAAGGKTEDADLSKINLAYIIEDGIQIYVPSITETTSLSEESEKEIKYITDGPGEDVIVTEEAQKQGEEKQVKVNINTANIEKLQTLPGIGESIAQKIIDYRNENGKFKAIEELKNVSGIGESKYNNIKDKISV